MSNGTENREQWGSRFGFIMAAAGSAIGLGNIWRFPYITGKYGGAAFVAVYLAIVFSLGISIMLAEMVIGRDSGLNAVGAFRKLKGGAWPIVGWMGVGHGRMPELPEGSPYYKIEFASAWNAMLSAVNEATKVGIHKPHREHPIMLMADLEVPDNTPRIITPEHIEWN